MPKIQYLHKPREEISDTYARKPSIILQNMNFSRYYRYRAQLIYSFDLNIFYSLAEYRHNILSIVIQLIEILRHLSVLRSLKQVVFLGVSEHFDCPRITCGSANLWAVARVICGRTRHNMSFKIEEHEKAEEHVITLLHRYSG